MDKAEQIQRQKLGNAKRLVIKLGTRVISDDSGRPDQSRLKSIAGEIARLVAEDREIVLVSSGAIGAGIEALGLAERPKTLSSLQMCAAVGQSQLMAIYEELFSTFGLKVGQVLLTRDGLADRKRYLNIKNTLRELFEHKIVPVVNENDVVSVEELCFGDNDMLAAMVSVLTDSDGLLLLSTADGLRKDLNDPDSRISFISDLGDSEYQFVSDQSDKLSTGGMKSKLEAAALATGSGVPTIIASGAEPSVIESCLLKKDIGSLFGAKETESSSSRKKWLAIFPQVSGALVVDSGAEKALKKQGVSLLPVGIKAIEDEFESGDLVAIKNESGEIIARGLTAYSHKELEEIKGLSSSECREKLGNTLSDEVVHRDNMVIV
jgi:glutamate 5-kinase